MAEPGGSRQTQILTIMAFAAGVAVGMNWPKIKKRITPLLAGVTGRTADVYAGIAKFFAEQKEKAEDTVASTKVRKVKRRTRKTLQVNV